MELPVHKYFSSKVGEIKIAVLRTNFTMSALRTILLALAGPARQTQPELCKRQPHPHLVLQL